MSEQTKEGVQVGGSATTTPGIELAVQNPISTGMQVVQDEDGGSSALSLSSIAVQVSGQDNPGSSLPLEVSGTASQGGGTDSTSSWGRVIRVSTPGGFFDIGIDVAGNFFINGPSSSPTVHVLAIPSGGLQAASNAPPSANLAAVYVDTNTGTLYHQ
jgi:hypothetical protein